MTEHRDPDELMEDLKEHQRELQMLIKRTSRHGDNIEELRSELQELADSISSESEAAA